RTLRRFSGKRGRVSLDLDSIAWPSERIGDAIEALAIAGGLSPRAVTIPSAAGAALANGNVRENWIEQTASYLGVEAEPLTVLYREVADVLRPDAPTLVQIPGAGPPRFVALPGSRSAWRGIAVLRPDGRTERVPVEILADHLCAELEAK